MLTFDVPHDDGFIKYTCLRNAVELQLQNLNLGCGATTTQHHNTSNSERSCATLDPQLGFALADTCRSSDQQGPAHFIPTSAWAEPGSVNSSSSVQGYNSGLISTMRTSTALCHLYAWAWAAAAAFLALASLGQAFIPALAPLEGMGHRLHTSNRCRTSFSSRMSLQTPPSQEKSVDSTSDTEVKDAGGLVEPLETEGGSSTSTDGEGSKKRVLGRKEPEEQDLMWKLKVRWRCCDCVCRG